MSLESTVKPLGFGVDTIYINVYATDGEYKPLRKKIDPDLKLQLDAWKEQAQEDNDPALTSYVFDGTPLMMKDKGGTGSRWIMENQALSLGVNANSKMMLQAKVRVSSEYLWKTRSAFGLPDLGLVVSNIHHFLTPIFGSLIFLQVSGLDMALDVVGFDVGDINKIMSSFVSRAQRHDPHFNDEAETIVESDGLIGGVSRMMQRWRRLTGVSWGVRDAQLSVVIYDKTHDIRYHATEKGWFYDLWLAVKDAETGLPVWDGKAPVWRTEVRYRRQALHEMTQDGTFEGIESAWEVEGHIPGLWQYAVGHPCGGEDGLPDGWLRYVIPTDDINRSRWPVHPDWNVIQDGYKLLFPELEETTYERHKREELQELQERDAFLEEVDAALEVEPMSHELKYGVLGIDVPLPSARRKALQAEEKTLAAELGMNEVDADALFLPDPRLDLHFYVRKRKRQVAIERAVNNCLGWASTVAAWRTNPDRYEQGIEPDLSEVYHFLYDASEHRLQETGRDFNALTQRKRKLYHIAVAH